MKFSLAALLPVGTIIAFSVGCGVDNTDVVDLNKVMDALVAVLDEIGRAHV